MPLLLLLPEPGSSAFLEEERYSDHTFCGILPDTSASGLLIAGLGQAKALIRLIKTLTIEATNKKHTVNFGVSFTISSGILNIPIIFGNIPFYILNSGTPFLYSITDIDRIGVKLDNINNLLI